MDHHPAGHSAGAFATAFVAFPVAEMGDKTQLATVALAARFDALWGVVLGTTFEILIADAPAVFMGGALERGYPLRRDGDAVSVVAGGLNTLSLSASNHFRCIRCRSHRRRIVCADYCLPHRVCIIALRSILFPTLK